MSEPITDPLALLSQQIEMKVGRELQTIRTTINASIVAGLDSSGIARLCTGDELGAIQQQLINIVGEFVKQHRDAMRERVVSGLVHNAVHEHG